MSSGSELQQTHLSTVPTSHRHPVFWLNDGSLILQIESTLFKVHRTLLTRHSPFLLSLEGTKPTPGFLESSSNDQIGWIDIDPARNVAARDFEALLEHLYHDVPLSREAPFPRIASVVRISSPSQLHFPRIHEVALRYFADLFPSGPAPFLHPPYLEEALALAVSFKVISIQKGLYYSLVTTTNFDTEEAAASHDASAEANLDSRKPPGSDVPLSLEKQSVHGNPVAPVASDPTAGPAAALLVSPSTHKYVLSPQASQRCLRLMTHFIDHFSPILFTAPATPHMACTDVFAGTWMKNVIEPAIKNEGVYKPLETLEDFKRVDWAKVGLCPACILQKTAEWTEEQEMIWKGMDEWLDS